MNALRRAWWLVVALPAIACHGPPDGVQPHDFASVDAIVSARCAGSMCHAGAAVPAEGLDLSPGWWSRVVEVPSLEAPELELVRPWDPAGSYLACKVARDCPLSVGTHMPPEAGLAPGEVAIVRAWIAAGAPGPGGPIDGGPIDGGPDGSPADAAAVDSAAADGALYDASPTDGPPAVDAPAPDAADLTPPVFAGLATAVAQTPSSILLTWAPASDDVTPTAAIEYAVHLATASGAEDLATPTVVTAPGATSDLVVGLAPDTRYWFIVRARDEAGNIDGNVVEQSALTPTPTVSFAADVQPVFSANCTGVTCHASGAAAEGLDLSSGPVSLAHLVSVPATECPAVPRVSPGDAGGSFLIWKLLGSGPCFGGLPMPLMSPPLPPATINKIGTWIDEGALDD